MNESIEVLTNGLTLTTVLLCISVVVLWFDAAKESIFKRDKAFNTESWFIVGVFFGFIGEILENFYWLIYWTLYYLELDSYEWFLDNGFYFNLIFRQTLGIFSAYCHIRSALEYRKEKKSNFYNKILKVSIFTGIIYSFSLLLSKYLILINF